METILKVYSGAHVACQVCVWRQLQVLLYVFWSVSFQVSLSEEQCGSAWSGCCCGEPWRNESGTLEQQQCSLLTVALKRYLGLSWTWT